MIALRARLLRCHILALEASRPARLKLRQGFELTPGEQQVIRVLRWIEALR